MKLFVLAFPFGKVALKLLRNGPASAERFFLALLPPFQFVLVPRGAVIVFIH
jgi:hypothetical protein